MNISEARPVAIIGAGLAGLTAATFLRRHRIPFILYESGHDYWMYQRYAYRIVMQGYWLEAGSTTFYFQAFYRWIVAALHVAFGDSSAGEWYWDGACLLTGALLSFRIARTYAGFQWGLAAAALTLAVFVLGTAQYLIGQGLVLQLQVEQGDLHLRCRHE